MYKNEENKKDSSRAENKCSKNFLENKVNQFIHFSIVFPLRYQTHTVPQKCTSLFTSMI